MFNETSLLIIRYCAKIITKESRSFLTIALKEHSGLSSDLTWKLMEAGVDGESKRKKENVTHF